MQRITITSWCEDEYGDPRQKVVGWFDADVAEKFAERREAFDGANLAGVHLRDQNRGQTLYHTKGDRWVLLQWSCWKGEADDWQYIGVADAQEWLILNGESDETMQRLFGAPPEPERGPGRPEIGPTIDVRMPQEMIARVDDFASKVGLSRAETIRQMIARALAETEAAG
jgi:hypothetical protein